MLHQGIILREGHITRTIYNLIKDKRYDDVIDCVLNFGEASTTRAGLSILALCYFRSQKYEDAASCYEQLCSLVPKEKKYRFYYAQSLYQAGLSADALKVLKQISDSDELKDQILQLQSSICYATEDYAGAQSLLNQRTERVANAGTLNDEGCLLYQADQYDTAIQRFNSAIQMGGFNPLYAYNVALCHFRKKEKTQALVYTDDIVERGIRTYPELGIGAQIDTEGSARSVGNPIALELSGITQALNLKAAIEYNDGNIDAAREALLDLPPRAESELDPVTLHNMALMDPVGPAVGLSKLNFLLELGPPSCPKETFANILLLCCKHEMYDTAADILAEHTHLTYKYLSQYLYELLDALITAQTSPEAAEKKLGTLASSLLGKLRAQSAKIQELQSDQNALRSVRKEYDSILKSYLPVVMARAWLAWRDDDFIGAEREFRSSAEFCKDNPLWGLHAGHVLFMQGDKYIEASAFYEQIVKQHYDDIMTVSADVLANLCVSYIMTFKNEEAEELMRKVEKAEEMKGGAGKQYHHLCIVNLVVGTLYCAKSNYEFGLSRIAHALDGGSGSRLYPDTWLHVKRCVLGLLAGMAKQNVILPYPAVQEILNFLHSCEVYGLLVPANIYNSTEDTPAEPLTIGMEARKLRVLLIKLTEYEN